MNIAIILNYNDLANCISLLECIGEYDVLDKIVVVDNCSTDSSYSELEKYRSNKIHVIRSLSNGGYGAGNNFGVRYASSNFREIETLTIMNPDILIEENVIVSMTEYLNRNSNVALVSPVMLLPDNSIFSKQYWKTPTKSSVLLEMTYTMRKIINIGKGEITLSDNNLSVGAISGPCLCFNYEKFMKTGMYDEKMFLYWEENYIATKIREYGWESVILVNEYYLHNHSESIKKNLGSEMRRMKHFFNSRKTFYIENLSSNYLDKILFEVLNLVNKLETRLMNLYRGVK